MMHLYTTVPWAAGHPNQIRNRGEEGRHSVAEAAVAKGAIYGKKVSKYVLLCRRDHALPQKFLNNKGNIASAQDVRLSIIRVGCQEHIDRGDRVLVGLMIQELGE